MSYDCLFLINGLGLGNSTRCHAVIERLVERGVRVHVMTSGNGLAYFAGMPCIASLSPMESFFYSSVHGHISGWRTLASAFSLFGRAHRKSAQVEALLKHVRPDIVVADSEYTLGPIRRRRIPVVALNNSDGVVDEYFRREDKPRGIRSHFWLVEFWDYLFCRTFCDLVISPAARPGPSGRAKIRRVGLIIRRSVLDSLPPSAIGRGAFAPPGPAGSVLFMLSGSIFASRVSFGEGRLPFRVDVAGRDGESHDGLTFHGKVMNNVALLANAGVFVINGGFSAVSEAIALNKPTFVIPVPGHAEQFLNARVVRDLGCGYIAADDEVVPALRRLHELGRWEGLRPRAPISGIDGAREAADLIDGFVRERRARAGRAGI